MRYCKYFTAGNRTSVDVETSAVAVYNTAGAVENERASSAPVGNSVSKRNAFRRIRRRTTKTSTTVYDYLLKI